jgi:hypothetical protein
MTDARNTPVRYHPDWDEDLNPPNLPPRQVGSESLRPWPAPTCQPEAKPDIEEWIRSV